MTVYGHCKRPHFRKSALAALAQLPDLRILRKTLQYLSQLDYKTHDSTLHELMSLAESDGLPFPYQVAMVLETAGSLHPKDPTAVASRIRKYALTKVGNWVVVQKALEAIAAYPYQPVHAASLADRHVSFNHPLVRRAACLLLLRGPKHHVRSRLRELVYDADAGLSRLALYFLRFIQDRQFAQQDIARMRKGSNTDFTLQRTLPRLYALAATEEPAIATETIEYIESLPTSRSAKLNWHKRTLHELLEWSRA